MSILARRVPSIALLLVTLTVSGCELPDGEAPEVGGERPSGFVAVAPPDSFEIRVGSRSFTPSPAPPGWDDLAAAPGERGHAIVQLHRYPAEQTLDDLAAAGVRLGTPLTGRAYLASLGPDIRTSAPVLERVRWAGPLRPEDRIDPALDTLPPGAWARGESGRVRLVVKLFEDADLDAAVGAARRLGGTVLGRADGARVFAASLPDGGGAELARRDGVRWIEPLLPPGSGESDRARAHVGANAGGIPAGRPTGAGVSVAVVDAGHVAAHGDFGNRRTRGDPPPSTAHPHPTMTAGMIAGSGAQSQAEGAATADQWRGIAPEAGILSYSFTNAGNDAVTDFLDDVDDAVSSDDVDVLNNSWGDFGCSTFAYGSYAGRAPFLDDVTAGRFDRLVPIVFSAGNERDGFGGNDDTSCVTETTAPFANYTTLNHPKAGKNLIVVGAVDSDDDAMSAYSSWGPTADGRLKPTVVASGHHDGTPQSGVTAITNAFGSPTGASNQQGYRVPIAPDPNFVYGWFSQTSSAAAIVSGAVARMIDGWRAAFPGRADPLPATIRAVLAHTARDLDDGTAWYNPGPDYASGYGVVRVNEAIRTLESGDALEGSVAHQGEARYSVTVPSGAGEFRVTLAWDDAAAMENANPALVNDLDLVVRNPNGVRRHPWTLDPSAPGSDAVRTQEDHRNNLEQVVVDAPTPGAWEVVVRGTTVATGRQSFGIVTEGGFDRPPTDLLMAVDVSGSMNSAAGPGAPAKIELLRDASELLLETWRLHAQPTDRAGLVPFASDVSTAPSGSPVLQPFLSNFASLRSAVNGLSASGCTALGGAVQVALDAFDPSLPNKRALVVLSDGMHSANPFIGETGSPPRLVVEDVPASGSPAFGGFFCTTAPATGPSGSAIAPDGTPLADRDTEIHSIGVGVNGPGFHELIERLASENDGVSHFTSSPQSDLDLLFVNDLVRALKSNTLEIVTTGSGTVASNAPGTMSFPVNSTARSVTVAASWPIVDRRGAVDVEVRGPSGAALAPSEMRSRGSFTVGRYDLRSGTDAAPGTWTVSLEAEADRAVPYQISVIVDESCFHYEFEAGNGPVRAGEQIALSARLRSGGRSVRQPPAVRATMRTPARAPGPLLAEWVPRTDAAREHLSAVRSRVLDEGETGSRALEAALQELQQNEEFTSLLRERETREVTLKPREKLVRRRTSGASARYRARLPAVRRAGTAELVWTIDGPTACGPVHREERRSVAVLPARPDTAATEVSVRPTESGFSVVVRPVDGTGTLVGPGRSGALDLEVPGRRPRGPVVDRLDGTYVRHFAGDLEEGTRVRLSLDGREWSATPERAGPRQR